MDTPTALVRGDALDGSAAAADRSTSTRRGRARPHRTPASPAEVARQAAVLVGALMATIPLATITVLWHAHGGQDDLNRSVVTAPFDLVLVITAVWALAHLGAVRALFRSPAVRFTSIAYAGLSAVAFAAHPSPLGIALGLRLLAGVAVIAAVGVALSTFGTRRAVLAVMTAVGVAQAVLAMVQARHGTALGISYVDFSGRLYLFGHSRAGRGGLTHPYHLAVLLLVAQSAAVLGYRCDVLRQPTRAGQPGGPGTTAPGWTRWVWVGAIVVLGLGLGVTYSRSALLGQAAAVVVALLSRDRRVLLPVVAAILLGLGLGGVGFGDGWVAKSQQTADSGRVDSNRRVRLQESVELMKSSPAVGVGPGRYVEALARTDRVEYLPAHDLVAQEGAELGVLGYLVSAAFLLLLALRAWRGGAWTFAVAAPLVPFLVLDAYPYVFATGIALSALWLGLVRASLEPEPIRGLRTRAGDDPQVTA